MQRDQELSTVYPKRKPKKNFVLCRMLDNKRAALNSNMQLAIEQHKNFLIFRWQCPDLRLRLLLLLLLLLLHHHHRRRRRRRQQINFQSHDEQIILKYKALLVDYQSADLSCPH